MHVGENNLVVDEPVKKLYGITEQLWNTVSCRPHENRNLRAWMVAALTTV